LKNNQFQLKIVLTLGIKYYLATIVIRKVKIQRSKPIIFILLCGILVSLLMGLLENNLTVTIIGAKNYGYPLAWRTAIVTQVELTNYNLGCLGADFVFWSFIFYFLLKVIDITKRRKIKDTIKSKRSVFFMFLFLLSALFMDFLHELGHVLWGVLAGGRLVSMQILYFMLYPSLGLASRFQLGLVRVTGFSSSFEHGLFLLGGSLTTFFFAWIIALILKKKPPGQKFRMLLKSMGIIGLLDLPFYVFLPQIGLYHWMFFGGNTPEPLIGARETGIPDSIFYFIVILSTFTLALIYFASLRKLLSTGLQKLLIKIKDVF
jgi:hypothetical protein